LYLGQTLLDSVGAATVYFPVVTETPLHFSAHCGLPALGIALSGAGFSGLVYAPVLRTLISRVGVLGALRWLGLINFALTFPIGFVIKSKDGKVSWLNLRVAKKKTSIFEVVLW
jgi:hypothetical protein